VVGFLVFPKGKADSADEVRETAEHRPSG
jgi:hypothetical protein